MTFDRTDVVIGLAFVAVFVSYGIALRQRLLAYRDMVQAAGAELERRRANGLATADAERAYDEAAEALNDLLNRFPSNVAGRMLNIAQVPTVGPDDRA